MKSVELTPAPVSEKTSQMSGLSNELSDLCAQEEFAALRKTLEIYALVLRERAM